MRLYKLTATPFHSHHFIPTVPLSGAKLGKGTRVVSVTVEIDLLERADAYPRQIGAKRSESFTQGVKAVLPQPTKGENA